MDHGPLSAGGFPLFVFQILLRDGEAAATTRSNKVLPPYPRSGGASSAGGGRVELCVRWISGDPVGFRVC